MSHTNLKLRQGIWPLSKAISLCVYVCVKLFRAMLLEQPPEPQPLFDSICVESVAVSRENNQRAKC